MCTLHRGEHAQRTTCREKEKKRERIKDRKVGDGEEGEGQGEEVDRHLFILDPVFARLHEVHVINTRSNSLRRKPPTGLNTLMHVTNTRDNILGRTRNRLRMETASNISK